MTAIFTIGHSNVPAEQIIHLLKQHQVQILVDVRSTPASRWNPQFNQAAFSRTLLAARIEYIYAGDALGGRPKDPTCYKPAPPAAAELPLFPEQSQSQPAGKPVVDFAEIARRPWYQEGIDRLVMLASERCAAVLCSEEDPAHCHRQHLIAQTLLQRGVQVWHIRRSGELQPAWKA